MPRIVTATELQKNTRAVIDWVRTRSDEGVVETYNKPMVAILPFAKYQDYLVHQQMQKASRTERFERLRQLAEQNADFNKLSAEDAAALVEEVREQVYRLGQGTDGNG